MPSIKKDAKQIDQIFTDNLKRQDPEPLFATKEQTGPMISCGANGDCRDREHWKIIISGSGRKASSPPADLQWQNRFSALVTKKVEKACLG